MNTRLGSMRPCRSCTPRPGDCCWTVAFSTPPPTSRRKAWTDGAIRLVTGGSMPTASSAEMAAEWRTASSAQSAL